MRYFPNRPWHFLLLISALILVWTVAYSGWGSWTAGFGIGSIPLSMFMFFTFAINISKSGSDWFDK